ncbi:MAG: serine/threonine-protein kinase [Pseudomonadota bacterium]
MVPKGGGGGSPCVDENGVLDFVQGRLSGAEVARVDEHADGCLPCRMAIDEAVRTFRERATGFERPSLPVATRFATGDHLAGRYRIVRFIARGGMGEVYEAEDEMLGTRIAVKTVAAAISDNPHVANRLKQEVNLARRITHPNVCRIFDLGVQDAGDRRGDGVLFLTMELIAGVSLAQRLRGEGRFSPQAALPIVKAMAAAIGAAHAAGVVHRDFKSDNVMLATSGADEPRVVVMDFGLARGTWLSTHDSIEGRGIAGTLAYMAPEQLHGKRVGPAADIYALGVVMYEMLTGQLPFVPPEGEAGVAWALWRLSEPAPEVRSVVPDVDARWNDLVARCLEREIDRRPASADEVARALDGEARIEPAASGADPVPAPAPAVRPPSAAPAPAREPRRRWMRGGLVMGSLAALGALVAIRTSSPGPGHAAAAARPIPAQPIPPPRQPAAPPTPVTPAAVEPQARPSRVEVAASPQAADRRLPTARPGHRQRTGGGAAQPDVGAALPSGAATSQPAAPEPPPRSTDPDDGFIFK